MLRSSVAPQVSSSQNLLVESKCTTMSTDSSSIFSRLSGIIHYSFSSGASTFSTAGSSTMLGRTNWRRTSRDPMLTLSTLQYAPPTRLPHLSQVIRLADGLLIVVGPVEALTGGQASTIKSVTPAIGSDVSTSTI